MILDTDDEQKPEARQAAVSCCDDQCFQELLMSAVGGSLCSEQPLEHTLDQLERTK